MTEHIHPACEYALPLFLVEVINKIGRVVRIGIFVSENSTAIRDIRNKQTKSAPFTPKNYFTALMSSTDSPATAFNDHSEMINYGI